MIADSISSLAGSAEGGTTPWLLSLVTFAVSMSATPGPNNVMITAAAANFGFRRTLSHMLGVSIGFPVMLILVGCGLGSLLESHPAVHQALKYAGAAYLLFLAWKIGNAGRMDASGTRGRPFTFLQAMMFQWINPKAWIIAIGAVATYTTVGGDLLTEVLLISMIFALACLPSVAVWALFGATLGRLLSSGRKLRIFNAAMALLLAASLLPLLMERI